MGSFVELLKGFYSSNQAVREQSTNDYKQMAAERPDDLISALLETMATHPDVQVRLKLNYLSI